jgi:hypothetical protein
LFALVACSACREADETGSPSALAKASELSSSLPSSSGQVLTATGETWIPNEHKSGDTRWRDSVVYVDGVPIAAIWYGEIPLGLQPVWLDETEQLDFSAGEAPRTRTTRVRRFRLVEYLERLGVNLRKARVVHLYGGVRQVAVTSGPALLRVKNQLLFAFGHQGGGKPIIEVPPGLTLNTGIDNIASIAVYIKKKPPTLNEDEDLILNGAPVDGVPYYGPPMRGGIRIYVDDRIAAVIKRNKLDEVGSLAHFSADGKELRWGLLDFLRAFRVRVDKLKVGDLIYEEQSVSRFDRAVLEKLYFVASSQGRGQIVVGDERQPVEAIMLYTHTVPARPRPPKESE